MPGKSDNRTCARCLLAGSYVLLQKPVWQNCPTLDTCERRHIGGALCLGFIAIRGSCYAQFVSALRGHYPHSLNRPTVYKSERSRGCELLHSVRMKKKELTSKQISAVPCPTCHVAAGKRCELLSGAPRSEPHVDRKLSAIEAIEGK